MAIERTFHTIPEGRLGRSDQQGYLVSLGWAGAIGWQELLSSKRVLIISEAGAGKTHECRSQCQRLWDAGEPAFFLELATLAVISNVRDMLSDEEEARLDAWLASQSDVATFFLDSFDELKLSQGSFEQALKRLAKGVAGQLGRVRIVITTRPIAFDEQLVRQLLPVPPPAEVQANGETFALAAMHGRANKRNGAKDNIPAVWTTMALMPLSDAQIAEFARGQGVDEPKALLEDLRRRNAQEFARRPQDLIELCADWRNHNRIRTHREQVGSNIFIKLKPREDRREPAELSVEKAIEGASRLALAMMGTRRLTIRHSAEADSSGDEVALDPAVILSDWSTGERKALLERPLFGFASYGRVRFHHRSVAEYLASERIKTLRTRGMPARALRRLIFAQTKGKTIVRPSKRSLAGWLALTEDLIFETLRDHEPAVLFAEGDPESLSPSQRSQALCSYVKRYSKGGWRGLTVPHIQIHRFASPELGGDINRLWVEGIENSEVREILLNLIEMGRISACSDLARATALNTKVSNGERINAIDALATLNDPSLESITASIAEDVALWPEDLARVTISRLFPEHLTAIRLCQILARLKDEHRSGEDLGKMLSRLIIISYWDAPTLEALRDGLSKLASMALRLEHAWPDVVSNHSHLSSALAATCVCGLKAGTTADWLRASVLATRLPHCDNGSDEAIVQLQKFLAELTAEDNAQLFWAEDSFIQCLHFIADPWERLVQITVYGSVRLIPVRDLGWIKTALADSARPLTDRALLLEAAIRLAPSPEEWRKHMIELKALVADQPEHLATIENQLKPSKPDREHKSWQIEAAKRKKQQERQQAKDHESWVMFWRKVAEQPDSAFSPESSSNTAWNLWRAMSKVGDESRASGWNRRFIEDHFGKKTADRLRLTLMAQWRRDLPTLPSERPADAKDTYLMRWQLGLAAIYAEAEDPKWAAKLSEEEAKLAARYAPIELNSLPLWMDALVKAHPSAVDATLGQELSLELEGDAHKQWHSMLLQNIEHAEAVAIAFLPRLRSWLDKNGNRFGDNEDLSRAAHRLALVVGLLRKHGDAEYLLHLRDAAKRHLDNNTSFSYLWISILMRLDAIAGVQALENRIRTIEPAQRSEAVTFFAKLFGDRHDSINLADPQFTPSILLRLLRLSYHHVRPADDVKHERSHSQDVRDDAERARYGIVDSLLKAKGEDGWAAKLEMADDPLCAHFKDRIVALAEENWAEEIDAIAFDDAQAIALDKTGEAPPTSNEAMFAIMVDRLDDIEELLLRDESSRELWATITKERVMRRAIARELKNHANGLYTIDQEAVTADEKETDIRLRSTASSYQGVIELKLADKRTVKDLRDTLEAQLVAKYMAAETSRSGCLMFTLAKDRSWYHPDNGSPISSQEVITLLRKEAASIMEKLGGTLRLHVHALDLSPRLPTEAKGPKAKRTRKKVSV